MDDSIINDSMINDSMKVSREVIRLTSESQDAR